MNSGRVVTYVAVSLIDIVKSGPHQPVKVLPDQHTLSWYFPVSMGIPVGPNGFPNGLPRAPAGFCGHPCGLAR